MKLVKPSFEIIDQNPGFKGLLQHIERCGRTCYKSEDKITDESAPKFVDMLVKRGHTAMVEHGTVYLQLNNTMGNTFPITCKYEKNKYSTVVTHENREDLSNRGIPYTTYNITTNYRVLLQNDWLDDLQYQCEPTEHHVKRVTVKFTCDRGVSHEFVRHRVFSFAQESTRYCNYAKNKFGNECTFIIPSWLNIAESNRSGLGYFPFVDTDLQKVCQDKLDAGRIPVIKEDLVPSKFVSLEHDMYFDDSDDFYYLRSLIETEKQYFKLLERGWIAQQARAVLPNSLKTELIMTGTIEQWKDFFILRDDKQHAHPQAYELAHPLHEEFKNRNYIQ